MRQYAVIDPNWGEPVVLLTTVAGSTFEAMEKAVVTTERGAHLYSGAAFVSVTPIRGKWSGLQSQGYRVAEVEVSIKEYVS